MKRSTDAIVPIPAMINGRLGKRGANAGSVKIARTNTFKSIFRALKYRNIFSIPAVLGNDMDEMPIGASFLCYSMSYLTNRSTERFTLPTGVDAVQSMAGILAGILMLGDVCMYTAVDQLDASYDDQYEDLQGTCSMTPQDFAGAIASYTAKIQAVPILRQVSGESWMRYGAMRTTPAYIEGIASMINKDSKIESIIGIALECAGCVGGLPSMSTLKGYFTDLGVNEAGLEWFAKNQRTFLKPIQAIDLDVFVDWLKDIAAGFVGLEIAVDRYSSRGTMLFNNLEAGIRTATIYGPLAALIDTQAKSTPVGESDNLSVVIENLLKSRELLGIEKVNKKIIRITNEYRGLAIAMAATKLPLTEPTKRDNRQHRKLVNMLAELTPELAAGVQIARMLNSTEVLQANSRPRDTYSKYSNLVLTDNTAAHQAWEKDRQAALAAAQSTSMGGLGAQQSLVPQMLALPPAPWMPG